MNNEDFFTKTDNCIVDYIEYICDTCSKVQVSKLSQPSKYKYFVGKFNIDHIDIGIGVVRIKTNCMNCC